MDRLRAMELLPVDIAHAVLLGDGPPVRLSATAVSRDDRDFEGDLKVKLLLRSTRQVALTEAGKENARQLEGSCWSISEAQAAHGHPGGARGALRVHSRTMFGLRGIAAPHRGVPPPVPGHPRRIPLAEAQVDLRREQVDIDLRIRRRSRPA